MSVSLHEHRPRHWIRSALRIGLTGSLGVLGLAGIAGVTAGPASAGPPSISGYATNFDVPDGTDKECEGFEVDIEDIAPARRHLHLARRAELPQSVRPGHPVRDPAQDLPRRPHGRVGDVPATYSGGAWSSYTPIGQVNHFGVHVTGTPGVQAYTWLCDLGGHGVGSTGVLVPYGGTTVRQLLPAAERPLGRARRSCPTPTGEGVAPVIVPAETPQPAKARFPDAVFVKKYRTIERLARSTSTSW